MSYNYINTYNIPYIIKEEKHMNTQNNYKTAKTLLIASAVCALLSAVARSVLTLTLLDVSYGIYAHGSIAPTVYHIMLAAVCIALVGYAVIFTKENKKEYNARSNTFTLFASFACAFILAAELAVGLVNIATGATNADKFSIIEMCFSVPAIVYFVFIALKPEKRSTAAAFTSFFPTAWCAICLIRIYFDSSLLMTSPENILSQMALLAAMLFFLSESRMQVSNFKDKFFLAAASAAPVLLITHAVPDLLFADKLLIGESGSILRCAAEAALALFMYARLVSYIKNNESV